MDFLSIAIVLLSLAAWFSILRAINKPSPGPQLPPGPSPLPIFGNILALGPLPHRSLAKLAKAHGPVMLLKLGRLTSVVISSPDAARAVLQKHDQALCGRAVPDSITALDHHRHSVGWMPVCDQWRRLRKLCKEGMFSAQRLDSSQGLRMEKLRKLAAHLDGCAAAGTAVDIGKVAFATSLNLMSASLFSVDVVPEFESVSCQEFKDVVGGMSAMISKPNAVDYFPILRAVDPQGIRRRITGCYRRCFELFDEIIERRVEMKRSGRDPTAWNDLLEYILENEQDWLSMEDIKHLFLDLFAAGSDTTANTVEWAMTELIRNPDKMLKAKNELKHILNPKQPVQESDIPKLPYLQAVVKETFRLHPVVPLSVPHKAEEDTEVCGYIIPKDAQILTNIWAMGRDSTIWPNPEKFMPERFLDMEIDFRGQHFGLIPFGAGRRICLGLPLAHRTLHLMLATLIRDCNWRIEGGKMAHEKIDMGERFGLTLQRAIPLTAIPLKDSFA